MKHALFVASAVSYFREMAPVVWHFADNGWQVRVLLGSISPLTTQVIEECKAHGISVDVVPANVGYGSEASEPEETAGPETVPAAAIPKTPSRFRRWVRAVDRGVRLSRFVQVPGDWIRMRRIRNYADAYIDSLKPDVVFQGPYHSVGQIDNGIARVCISRVIPRYCLPNSGYLGGKIMGVGRSVHLQTGMASSMILADYDWVNRLFARFFPEWTCRISDGRKSFYWDPVFIFSAWMNGLFFDRLWVKPARDLRRVFVFSDYSADLLKADDYPMEKVAVSGQPLLDTVWHRSTDPASGAELFRYLNLAPGTPFLLVNIEPSAEHSYCDWERHWANFDAVMKAVTAHNMRVVLSLHPLCDARRYDFAEEKYGVFICRDYKIHDLYPFCAISISFPCSTNLLASIFGKPLVIFDFFGLTDADDLSRLIHALPGAEIAVTGEELAAIVKRLAAKLLQAVHVTPPARLACDAIRETVEADLGIGQRAVAAHADEDRLAVPAKRPSALATDVTPRGNSW